MKAWYFSRADKKLGYGDGRPIVLGETHTVDCDPVVCRRGLHGSKLMLDAFNYASGPIVWSVELGGELHEEEDKIAATERTYLYGGVDVSGIFYKFARLCALDVVHLWDAQDVVVRFLKTGDESLRAAARAAVVAVAGEVGEAALYAAMWATTWNAAWNDGVATAWTAARNAAGEAARASARKQGDAAKAAARECGAAWHDARAVGETAWASAWADARAKQNRRLTAMVSRAIKKEL